MVLFLVVLVGQGGCYLDRFDRLGDLSRRGHRRVSAVKERPFSSRRDGMRFHNSHSTDSVVDVIKIPSDRCIRFGGQIPV